MGLVAPELVFQVHCCFSHGSLCGSFKRMFYKALDL
uniref:Uncharacterized protein n=1 Tax=Anguilla anguilla TaxID=7936 RepID=A0A0E9TK76_ANGAN